MDFIPNKVLLQIIGCLNKEEIPKMRLISNRFNLLATEWVKELYQVEFAKDSDISEFVTIFKNKAVVPFEKFAFSQPLFQYGQPFEEFCVHFGKLVKYWSVLKYRVSKKSQILLQSCVNVEEIDYSIEERAIGKLTTIPVLRNLKTITITELNINNKNFPPFLHQIFQKSPNIWGVSIKNLKIYASSHHETAADILNQLYNMNETVKIQRLYMQLVLMESEICEKLLAALTQFKIVDLELDITVFDRHSEKLPQTVEILSKWIQNLTSVRKFSMTYDDPNRPHVPIAMPLYSLSKFQCLELWREFAVYIPVVPGQQMEFPVLTSLICNLYPEYTNNFIFSGCVFPNVKFAQIILETEEDCEQWTWVIPNIEELLVNVSSETLKAIFRFPKLRKLGITMDYVFDPNDDEVRRYWNHLTGGAEYVSDSSIWSFPVTARETSDSIDSFRNLPLLTHLTLDGRNVECWKGIIYASRTGQLRRLQKLVLTSNDFAMAELYRAVLMQYHDIVSSCNYTFSFYF